MIDTLNKRPNTIGVIPQHEYLFWLDKSAIRKLNFKPSGIELKMVLVDSTGTKRKYITDYSNM